jgi:hypothetical protein
MLIDSVSRVPKFGWEKMPGEKIAISEQGGFYSVSNPEVLVVLLHAFEFTPNSLQRVAEVVREEIEQSDIYAPVLPVSRFSCATLMKLRSVFFTSSTPQPNWTPIEALYSSDTV